MPVEEENGRMSFPSVFWPMGSYVLAGFNSLALDKGAGSIMVTEDVEVLSSF